MAVGVISILYKCVLYLTMLRVADCGILPQQPSVATLSTWIGLGGEEDGGRVEQMGGVANKGEEEGGDAGNIGEVEKVGEGGNNGKGEGGKGGEGGRQEKRRRGAGEGGGWGNGPVAWIIPVRARGVYS